MITAAELVLRALPVSTTTRTDYYVSPNIKNYPPYHGWTMATGWDLRNAQRMRSNNLGFAAEHDFFAGADAVGLIGDSYVEASMLPLEDRPAAQLERALDGRLVYALGGPGSSMLDYAERIKWAHQTLQLTTFVVLLEHADASQAVCGSGNVHSHCLLPSTLEPAVRRQSSAGPLKEVLRESALAQYLNSQLKLSASQMASRNFWRSGTPSESKASSGAAPVTNVPAYLASERQKILDAVVATFFEHIHNLEDLNLVFVIDMNRRNLEPGVNQPDEGYYLAERLRDRGQLVVQGAPLYQEHKRRSPLRLDVGPHDGHLNRIGIALLMDAASTALKQTSTNVKEN